MRLVAIKAFPGGHIEFINPSRVDRIRAWGPDRCVIDLNDENGTAVIVNEPTHVVGAAVNAALSAGATTLA